MADTTIVLCGGSINQREIPLAMQTSNAMIPVNGRPVIGWILNDLLNKGLNRVVVVTRADDIMLHRFLERCYSERMELQLARLYHPGTIVDSLQAGLQAVPEADHIRLVLGDTLITDSFESDEDFVYTGTIDYAGRWCLVETDSAQKVTNYIDKQASADPELDALAGYYHLVDGDLLRECVSHIQSEGLRELSDVLNRYGVVRDIHAVPARGWYDFGHIDKLAEARHQLLAPRSFNSLEFDSTLQSITKSSSNNTKLAHELDWYLSIPDEIKVLAPRILAYEKVNGHVRFTQEFYGYNSLSELYVFGDLSEDIWLSILRKVLSVHQLLRKFERDVSPEDMLQMYYQKLLDRIQQLQDQDVYWIDLFAHDTIYFNGRPLANLHRLLPQIEQQCRALVATGHGSIIHGDLCFSNILFDLPHQIVRLVDPRGSFGRPGVHGDPRYDVAKLRHSVCGLYDYIVSDMFSISESGDTFQARVHALNPLDLRGRFDAMIADIGYDQNEIRFIEGLLFASMLPLHADRPDCQKMMYCRALELLNDSIEAEAA